MFSADPSKPKRPRPKGGGLNEKSKTIPPTPANDAGVSVFGAKLNADELSLGAKLPLWTVKEATYLTAGCKPPLVLEAIANTRTEFDWLHEPVLYRETLLKRHLQAGDAGELIIPLEALQILQRLEQWVDPKMLQAVISYHRPSKRYAQKLVMPLVRRHLEPA